ncbi:EAL domain-containing protein [Megalodesulfovibrio gigas]|uniref:Putative sensory box protein n=1 Tax=Megalodesulfovibrio gigas (strain ATCC 19364 / DSM 1382 / NCIMB 9332 / VKM B-1759) TaxID=1121448 RepID=T2GDX7_MEGG1|nr:EAL domain-containing protein [Megalodesulfovibrio gigas]AGW14384.1 putative sensory box protein [Megalodesulfovibrio gigas DSM 1382 = ATCC 19364]
MRHSRLFRRTLAFMVTVFGVMALASSLISGIHISNELQKEYASKALALAVSLAESDMYTLLQQDVIVVQSRIDTCLEIEGVAYVLVADEHGRVLAHTVAPGPSPAVLAEVASFAAIAPGQGTSRVVELKRGILPLDGSPARTSIHAVWPILHGLGGAVHVGMDKASIHGHFWSAFLAQQVVILGLFLASAAAAWLFVRSISRPLIRLSEYSNRVAAHDFSVLLEQVVDLKAQDEVGELARSMRSMAGELAQHIEILSHKAQSATDELEDALAYLSAIINSMPNGLLVVDSRGIITRFNKAFLGMLQLDERLVLGRPCMEVLGARPTQELGLLGRGAPPDACSVGAGPNFAVKEIELAQPGRTLPVEVSTVCLRLHEDRAILCVFRDITERKQNYEISRRAQEDLERKVEERTRELSHANALLKLEAAERSMVGEALRKAEARYRSIFEKAVEGIFQISTEGRYLAANPALARIFGYDSPDEFMTAVAMAPERHFVDPESHREFLRRIEVFGQIKEFQTRIKRVDGVLVWISSNGHKVTDRTGETLYFEGSVEDMTVRREMENALRQQAFHDPLTGLPNRMLFQDHLQLALERSKRRRDYLFAVLYMDLDRFKVINDSLGHETGDELLKAVARNLEVCVRATDTVARFGGDEFAILLEEIDAPREAVKIARRILEEVAQPLMLSGHEVFTTASMGIVLVTDGYERPDSILRDADTAMYKAKEQGKARFKVFNQKMHEQALRIMELESELRRAVERREIQVYYQPIVDLARQRIHGFEALSRWIHPRHGFIPPSEFIPLAEDTGLIAPLGAEVLRTACTTLLAWHQLFMANGLTEEADLPRMSVNISGKQFLQPSLVGEIQAILAETGLDPQYLTLEITENVLMINAEGAGSMLAKLKRLGVCVSMDDFGTGYSSLSYLRQFPIDHIKIDRGFVSSCDEDAESFAIIKTVLSLGAALGMEVVAEGVETVGQLGLLVDKGCQYGQGYLFSRPLPPEEMKAFIMQHMTSPHAAFDELTRQR